MRMKIQIQQLTANGASTVSEDQLINSMHNMMGVASQLQEGVPIPVNPDTEKYLQKVGLPANQMHAGSPQAAQRNAISAAAAVDSTGVMLKKWAISVSLSVLLLFY